MAAVLCMVVACDEVDREALEDPGSIEIELRQSPENPCPEGYECLELCLTGADGTEQRTGLHCCMEEGTEEGPADSRAVAQCLEGLRD